MFAYSSGEWAEGDPIGGWLWMSHKKTNSRSMPTVSMFWSKIQPGIL